jgi:hypothetical protein
MFPPSNDIRVLARSLQWVFGPAACQAHLENPVIIRRRKFDASLLAQTLVFGFWRHPHSTYAQLAQTACTLGCSVSAQAISLRCTEATSQFLHGLLLQCVSRRITCGTGASIDWLSKFTAVELLDSTTLTLPTQLRPLWPGCSSTAGQTAALKIQTCVDFLHGGLRLELHPGKDNDQKAALKTQDIQPGSLHVRDLGYFELDALQTIHDQGAFFVSRLQDSTALYDKTGKRLDLRLLLRNCQKATFDMPVLAGQNQRVPVRLLALRLPEEIARKRRDSLHAKGKKKGYTPQAATLELRGWSIYVTNADSTMLTAAQAQAVLRVRWQIELLFKLWKSHIGLDKSLSTDPARVLCETYAKLLAAVLQHWLMVQGQWHQHNRSWLKAAQLIRDWVTVIAVTLQVTRRLIEELRRLCDVINKTAHTNSRRKTPAAFQVIDDPERNGYKPAALT